MKIDALAVLVEHAAEVLEHLEVPAARPRPPVQTWDARGRAAVRRSIDGDDEDHTRHAPSMAGFLSALAASYDWGVPIRSSSDPSRYGGGGIGSGGAGRAPVALQAREEYALAVRELDRVASELTPRLVHSGHTFTGPAQVALWSECRGAGALELRVIKGGPARKVKGLGLVPASAVVRVPERRKRDATMLAERLRLDGIEVTPHEIGIICREVMRRAEAAFIARGWVRSRAKVAAVHEAEEVVEMGAPIGFDLEGWKDICAVVGRSENTCRLLAARAHDSMPVRVYLGKPIASRAELLRWVAKQAVAWKDAP